MAEYIFKEAERSSYLTADTNEIITTLEKKERITSCRDCKHSTEEGITTECYFCHLDRWNTNPIEASPVEGDGFCSWGEPDEQA